MRYVILAIIALVLAAGVITLMDSGEPQPQVNDGNHVLVARIDMKPGTFIIGAQMLDWVVLPEKDIKPEFMQKKNTQPQNYEGAVVRSLIKAGEPVVKENIVTPREGGFLSAVLYPGMRAISVAVDVVSSNAGFIFPGDRVDLLLTHEVDTPDGKKSYGTETFVEDVRVLAVDQLVSNPNNQALVPKTVTMEVTPKQAEEILVATQLGKISLVLRSMGGASQNNATKAKTEDKVQTFTRDSEVSKLINQYRPVSGEVTVTRGKESSTISTGGGAAPLP